MNWIKLLFGKKDSIDRYKRPVKTLYDFFRIYTDARHEQVAMRAFAWESQRERDMCKTMLPSKKIIRRYLLNGSDCNHLAWYLLEQYSLGNITIKEDELQSK